MPVQIRVCYVDDNLTNNLSDGDKTKYRPTTKGFNLSAEHQQLDPESNVQVEEETLPPTRLERNQIPDFDIEAEMAWLEAAKKEQQRENEINSAIRSLSTNLIISLVFLCFTFLWSFFSELFVVIALGLLKVLIPVVATASNFVKIHSLMLNRLPLFSRSVTADG